MKSQLTSGAAPFLPAGHIASLQEETQEDLKLKTGGVGDAAVHSRGTAGDDNGHSGAACAQLDCFSDHSFLRPFSR